MGSPALRGSAQDSTCTSTSDCPVFTLTGAGVGIGGTSDQFMFLSQRLTGDGAITVRLLSLSGSSTIEAGLMVRESLAANASHSSLLMSAGGMAFRSRAATGGGSASLNVSRASWLRLERSGPSVTASISSDGTQWTVVATQPLTLPSTVYVGLVVTSGSPSAIATATMSSMSVTPTTPTLPSGWASADVGAAPAAGSASYSNGSFLATSAGLGLGNASDGFRFIYRRVLGDTKLQARVVATQGKPNRQAGIALRTSLDGGAAEVALVADEAGLLLIGRTAAGQTAWKERAVTTVAPVYVQLDRRGSMVTVTYSTDGTTWKPITTLSVAFPSELFAGLAVAGGPNNGPAAAAFDRLSLVSVSANAAPVVSLTSPVNAQTFTQGQAVSMTATASDPDDLVARVEFLVNGVTVATDTAAPYSASWTAGTPGSYTLIARASDYEGAVTSSSPVAVTVASTTTSPPTGAPPSGSPSPTLPSGWASADVGAAPVAGTVSYSNGSFVATSAGLGLGNASDGFRFIYGRVLGDTKLQARVVATQGKPNRQAGIALRTSLDGGAAEVALVADEAGLLLIGRTAAGQTAWKERVVTTVAPVYVQLDRRGSTVTVTYSTDGTTWRAITTLSVAFPSEVFAGLAVAGGPNDGTATATFDRVSLPSLSANLPPAVSLTSPVNAQIFTQGQAVPMTATASDPDGLVARVDFLVNGVTVATDTAAPYSVSWTAGTPGIYTLIAMASDSAGAVTSSSPVTVTVVSTTSTPPTGSPGPSGPWRLTFAASLDDATLHHYQLDVYNHLSGVQVVTSDLGKPAKAADGSISVDVNTLVTTLPLGSYDAVVRSVLPSGTSAGSVPYNFNR